MYGFEMARACLHAARSAVCMGWWHAFIVAVYTQMKAARVRWFRIKRRKHRKSCKGRGKRGGWEGKRKGKGGGGE